MVRFLADLPQVPDVCTGALGSWGAALRKPYSDKPETSGILLSPPDALEKQVRQFWKDGFQVVRPASFKPSIRHD